MSEQRPRRRKPVPPPAGTPVKCTVLLDVETHARLAAKAALRRIDRSALAAEFIRAGLTGVVVFDKGRRSSGHDDSSSSEGSAA